MHANYMNPGVTGLNRCMWYLAAGLALALIWQQHCRSGKSCRLVIVLLLWLMWCSMTLLN